MRPSKAPPVFLDRASYRQRRLRDAIKFLPVLGCVLWLIPLLWSTDSQTVISPARATIYMFGVWVLLIIIMAVLAHRLKPDDEALDKDPSG